MCLADLYTYPPSMREAVARADGDTLDLLPRGNRASLSGAASPIPLAGALRPSVAPPATRDVPAIPLIAEPITAAPNPADNYAIYRAQSSLTSGGKVGPVLTHGCALQVLAGIARILPFRNIAGHAPAKDY